MAAALVFDQLLFFRQWGSGFAVVIIMVRGGTIGMADVTTAGTKHSGQASLSIVPVASANR